MRIPPLVCLGLGCGLIALSGHESRHRATVTERPAEVEVYVATCNIPAHTTLIRDNLDQWVKRELRPADSVRPSAVTTADELHIKRFRMNVVAGEVIDRRSLKPGRIIRIPPGMSMVAAPIEVRYEDNIQPGAIVDVVAALPGEPESTPTRLLASMMVLAVDAHETATVVSFAVNRKQAEVLALAKKLHLLQRLIMKDPEGMAIEVDETFNIDAVLTRLQSMKLDSDP